MGLKSMQSDKKQIEVSFTCSGFGHHLGDCGANPDGRIGPAEVTGRIANVVVAARRARVLLLSGKNNFRFSKLHNVGKRSTN